MRVHRGDANMDGPPGCHEVPEAASLLPDIASAKRKASMKSQKRNREERAYSRGYLAGFQGRPRDFCPFGTMQARGHWMSGWREGRTNHALGMTGVAGIHTLKDIG